MFETEVFYHDVKPRPFSHLANMIVEKGSKQDWLAWHELHYKANNLAAGSSCWRLSFEGECIGVVVMALPKGLLKERHKVMPKIASGRDTRLTNQYRYHFLNNNTRVVSRVVTDPVWRGVGIGYRLTNLVCRMSGMKFLEIQSSMSKFNPFAEKAGFQFAKPMNSTMFREGIRFFRTHFESTPQDNEAIVLEIEAMSPKLREKTIRACRDFYYSKSPLEKTGNNAANGFKRVEEMSTRTLVKSLQQLVIASPLYGVYVNPDYGRELPLSLPLSQFDCQHFNEPLKL